jgi:hypothetical protein
MSTVGDSHRSRGRRLTEEGFAVPGSVYKVIELVGTSAESWEDAALSALKTAAASLEDLRIAEVVKQDIRIEENEIVEYRVKMKVSFKYHSELAD